MSKTNQVCITCTQRDSCQYYDPNRTICVPVKVSDYGQFAGSLQSTIDWRQAYKAEVAKIMLPIMYRQVTGNGALVSSHSQVAVEAAVEVAEMMVDRLKGGGND